MTRRTIGGPIDLQGLHALAGNEERRRMQHFHALDRDQQAAAIKRLALVGHSESYIAAATQLSIEQIRRILAEHQ